jgi:purine-nucleoside phosphorylase
MMEKLEQAKKVILAKFGEMPKTVITLGSGLGSLLEKIEIESEMGFSEIPHFKSATVAGHSGKLVVGKLGTKRVACLKGRLHCYEGYSMEEVVFPFRTLAWCGAETFLLTNAAGGIHPDMKPGELMLITDHINLMGDNPLIGTNHEKLGTRFPDMSQVYQSSLRNVILEIAHQQGLKLRQGIYAGVYGPSYETPAEVNMLRRLGADAIGMSTVPEAIALNHMGRKIVAVSCITNLAAGVGEGSLNHEEVLAAAKLIQESFSLLVKEFCNVISK